MSLRLDLQQRQITEQQLEINQRNILKLLLRTDLHHPEFPEAAKGFEGMRIGHAHLQKQQAIGILIDGLADAVWNRTASIEELARHKDVDIAVVHSPVKIEPTAQGIDWWQPTTERITYTDHHSNVELDTTYYKNAFGTILQFGISIIAGLKKLPPGLYIPDRDWIMDMRREEALSRLSNQEFQNMDDEALNVFEQKLEKRYHRTITPRVRQAFRGFIMSKKYDPSYRLHCLSWIKSFSPQILKALRAKETAGQSSTSP